MMDDEPPSLCSPLLLVPDEPPYKPARLVTAGQFAIDVCNPPIEVCNYLLHPALGI